MKWPAIRQWNIRARVLFLALAPVLLCSLLLSYYVISSRIQDINTGLNERGRALAKHLAIASEFGLFSGNREQLQALAQSALLENDVNRIEILDLDRKKIVVVTNASIDGQVLDESLYARDPEMFQSFQEPVTASGIAAFDFAEGTLGTAPERSVALGVVHVVMSRQSTLDREREIITISILIGIGGLLLSMLFALRVGHSVVDPIVRLNSLVQRLARGALAVRVPTNSGGELGVLERGFNAMAASMEAAQRTLHQKVEEATSELQHTVETLELRNDELDTAREQATRAGQAKVDFLARMSHEIRTPINAVIGFTKLLTTVSDATQQREHAQTINQAAAQLLHVIDDILNFSRIESGAVQLEHIPFDLRDSLEEAVCMLRPSAHAKHLELVLMIDSDVPVKLIGDPTRFGQVLVNLINNAIKFTEVGSVTLRVELHQHSGAAALLRVSITDTGIGIGAEEQQRLFSAFSQADTSVSRRYGGTGLGLSIAKRLVELMHGEIDLDSSVGAGTTFWFTARCTLQHNAALQHSANLFTGKRLLLVEQHTLAQRALRNLCLDWGASVFTAAEYTKMRAMAFVAQHEHEPFDLIVVSVPAVTLDMQETCTQLTALREIYSGPILLLLNSEPCILPPVFIADAHMQCLAKPARMKTLHGTLARLLGVAVPDTYQSTSRTVAAISAFAGLRVLLAEDNAFNRTLITTWLTAQGVAVDTVHDGVAAVQRAQQERYDLILMDIHMPLLDGIEAARQIRADSATSTRVPIIALTADVFADDRAKLLSAGLDDCVFKPVHEETLWSVIAHWTGRAPRTVAMEATATLLPPEPHLVIPPALPESLRKKLHNELPTHLEQLRQALAARDATTLYEHAHKLNGLAGYFRIQALAQAACELERLAHAAQLDAAQSAFDIIEREVARTLAS